VILKDSKEGEDGIIDICSNERKICPSKLTSTNCIIVRKPILVPIIYGVFSIICVFYL